MCPVLPACKAFPTWQALLSPQQPSHTSTLCDPSPYPPPLCRLPITAALGGDDWLLLLSFTPSALGVLRPGLGWAVFYVQQLLKECLWAQNQMFKTVGRATLENSYPGLCPSQAEQVPNASLFSEAYLKITCLNLYK